MTRILNRRSNREILEIREGGGGKTKDAGTAEYSEYAEGDEDFLTTDFSDATDTESEVKPRNT